MPLSDLLRSLPALVIVVVAPGWLLARVIAPSWPAWYRLAAIPGLAVGAVGAIGLLLHRLGAPFSPVAVLPVFVVLLAVLLWASRLRATAPADGATPSRTRLVVLAALAAGVAGSIGLIVAVHGQPLPPDFDAATHGQDASGIARTHDIFPIQPSPLDGTSIVRSRPAFEATAVVVSWLGAPSPSAAMMPVTLVAVLLMPLSIAMLALETTRRWEVAAISALMSLGFSLPGIEVMLGRFPLVVDSTLVVPLVVAARRLILGRAAIVDSALMALAATLGIWLTHGLELLTAALIAVPVLIWAVVAHRRHLSLVGAGMGLAAVLAAAVIGTVLSRTPPSPITTPLEPAFAAARAAPNSASSDSTYRLYGPFDPNTVRRIVDMDAAYTFESPLALLLYAVGIVTMLVRRTALWAIAASIVFVVMLYNVGHVDRLDELYSRFYPWNEPIRIIGLHYWVAPLIMAFGVLGLITVARQAAASHRRIVVSTAAALVVGLVIAVAHAPLARAWAHVVRPTVLTTYPLPYPTDLSDLAAQPATWIVLLSVGALGWGLLVVRRAGWREVPTTALAATVAAFSLVFLGLASAGETRVFRLQMADRDAVDSADIATMQDLERQLPAGSFVLTDGRDDSGLWLPAVTDLNTLEPKNYVDGYPNDEHIVAMFKACSSPMDAVRELRDVRGVLIGTHTIADVGSWPKDCIGALPGVHLVSSHTDENGTAVAFVVTSAR